MQELAKCNATFDIQHEREILASGAVLIHVKKLLSCIWRISYWFRQCKSYYASTQDPHFFNLVSLMSENVFHHKTIGFLYCQVCRKVSSSSAKGCPPVGKRAGPSLPWEFLSYVHKYCKKKSLSCSLI